MKLLVQRVSKASVEIENQIIASINEGVLVFVGFDKKDNSENIGALANKLLEYKKLLPLEKRMVNLPH